jgi:hypothetical protein
MQDMLWRVVALAGTAILCASSAATAAPRSTAPTATGECPITAPNGRGPRGEVPNALWFGNGHLFTPLWDGTVTDDDLNPDGSITHKYPWWGVRVRGKLRISGRRLDTPAPPIGARINEGTPVTAFRGRFWATGIHFPTVGCWRVTGEVGRRRNRGHAMLRFIVLVRVPAKAPRA